MILLRALSRLMVYPTRELQESIAEIRRHVIAGGNLPAKQAQLLDGFLDHIAETALIRLQEEYVLTFDRGRHLSLHLFEHVHGESRDRGQAMVDLISFYREHGLELDARELPDYLPLMLEFLSTCDEQTVRDLLADAMPVVVLLGARLQQRESPYSALFDLLEHLIGSPDQAELLRSRAAREEPDWTLEKMDQIWEEEQVRFLGNSEPESDACKPTPLPGAAASDNGLGAGTLRAGTLRAETHRAGNHH